MENLDVASPAEALSYCRAYPGCQVIIMMNDKSRLFNFLESMRKQLQDDDYFLSASRAGIIKFKNGSYIRLVMCDSKARGLSAHAVYCDVGVVGSDISTNVKRLIYHIKEDVPVPSVQEDDPVTLDDFLSNFKIV